MSREGTVSVTSLWKRFHADRSRPVLRDEFERLRAGSRRSASGRWRWALRDVSVDIEPGEAVGLFGANGSGKSTLLKILTRVMYPTYGRLDVAGRVGALIEVRAGIHPDLTGRENIYLYGSLLGLKRAEVARRFDEIIAFAEVEEAVDRQLKFYSSGMGMRLGFAVAAYLNPDILLVDEVLAVGDAAFQQKCLNRMREVLLDGTTLVFVSHDLATIEATCRRGIWLHEGVVQRDGPVGESLSAYREGIKQLAETAGSVNDRVRFASASVTGPEGADPQTGRCLDVCIRLVSDIAASTSVCLGITEGPAAPVVFTRTQAHLRRGETLANCSIERLPLPAGRYYVWLSVLDGDERDLAPWHPVVSFQVRGPALVPAPPGIMRVAHIHVDTHWRLDHVG